MLFTCTQITQEIRLVMREEFNIANSSNVWLARAMAVDNMEWNNFGL